MQEEIGGILIRMEEEEEGGRSIEGYRAGTAEFRKGAQISEHSESREQFIQSLANQRETIQKDEKLSTKDKFRLLEENRKALAVATGGAARSTENVVYGILVFGGSVLIILALLTAFAHLDTEVTTSFVGTVLGGVIATIAQKLGRIGAAGK
jgi:hypothetical protein